MSQYITGNCYKCYTFNKPAPSGHIRHMLQNSICPDQISLFWLLYWQKESLALTLTSLIYKESKRIKINDDLSFLPKIPKRILLKAFDIFLIRGCVQFFSLMPFAACWVADNNNIADFSNWEGSTWVLHTSMGLLERDSKLWWYCNHCDYICNFVRTTRKHQKSKSFFHFWH